MNIYRSAEIINLIVLWGGNIMIKCIIFLACIMMTNRQCKNVYFFHYLLKSSFIYNYQYLIWEIYIETLKRKYGLIAGIAMVVGIVIRLRKSFFKAPDVLKNTRRKLKHSITSLVNQWPHYGD